MPKFAQNQIEEINAVISAIEAKLDPKDEIGARDRVILRGLLQANKISKVPRFFGCKREYSETIVGYFVKEKGLTRNKFSMNAQPFIFLI